jgi:hypothetical protein
MKPKNQKTKQKPFGKLTKAQKRVAIAKDAIKQITAKSLTVESGRYVVLPNNVAVLNQTSARRMKGPCRVCQIGQAIVCGIKLFNETSTESIEGSETNRAMKLVTRWFSEESAVAMEGSFENQDNWVTENRVVFAYDKLLRIAAFRKRHKTYRARSVAIWKNVIRNKGEFVP